MILLITGGCGFIGSNYVRWHRQHHPGDRLIILDALTYAGNLQNLHDVPGIAHGGAPDPTLRFVRGDICDGPLLQRLFAEESIEQVLHFAAESHVDRSILGPLAFVKTNVTGTATLLEAARQAGVRRFVHVSTDEVYGDLSPTDPAFTEHTPLAPRSPYAASKAASDLLVLAHAHTYHFPALITRCSNNYGPFQFPEKLIPLMILNALEDRPLPVYGDGQNVRDWIHVSDHCDGLDRVLHHGQDGQVYNLGGRQERKNLDIVHTILEHLGKPRSLVRFVTDRPGHDRRYAIDCSRAEKDLGFVPRHDLTAGLAQTIAWYRDHAPWWQAIRSGEYRTWYERNYGDRLSQAAQKEP